MPTVSRTLGELAPRPAIPHGWGNDQDELLYLHLGESPYAPLPRVEEALRGAVGRVHRYPDTSCRAVRECLAEYAGHGVKPEQIICGNGSDDLIDLICLTFAGPNGTVVSFDPTFFVYRACARRHGSHYASIPRDSSADFAFPDNLHLARGLAAHRPSVIFLANPNNPTGTMTPRERIEFLLQSTRDGALVVVDECYFEYSGKTVLDLLSTWPHLLVLRSLSKSGSLAGLRFGYAIGARETIDPLERSSLTFPVNALAQVAACAALEDADEIRRRAQTIAGERERMAARLKELNLKIATSSANLLLIASGTQAVLPPDCAARLAERGILVSDQTQNIGMGEPYLRVGVGLEHQTDRLVSALKEILEEARDGA